IAAYTVRYKRGAESAVIAIGETDDGRRFYARGDIAMAGNFVQVDPLGVRVETRTQDGQNMIVGLKD
ncbi:MAG: hypothetical protein AAF311_07295, partial [Pseudomonadota bacterium]